MDETSVTEPTLLADESTDRCLPCPSCVTCSNGAALPKLGYHKLDLSGREVGEFGNTLDSHHFLCPIEDACLAGGACTEGNAGLLCASCSESATVSGGNETAEYGMGPDHICRKCEEFDSEIVLRILGVFAAMAWLFWAMAWLF